MNDDIARFVLTTEEARDRCKAVIGRVPVDGPWYQVEIRPFKRIRSQQQNALLWATLDNIARRMVDADGVLHKPEIWHYFFRVEFGFVQDTMNLRGVDVPVPRSSTTFNVDEMSDYITQIQAWAAEQGFVMGDIAY